MSCQPILRDPSQENQPDDSEMPRRNQHIRDRRSADTEMARVL
jgi:hypothetical protein